MTGISTLLDSKKTLIMGILNVTPDSFYDGGEYTAVNNALKHVEKMVKDGADIIDVGGESTRPGSEPITLQEELKRVIPVIVEIAKRFSVPISVDTYKSEVAKAALDSGATMVNDISGLNFDNKMVDVVSGKKVHVIIMHIKGTPKNMQDNPQYENVVKEIKEFFQTQIEYALKHGVKKEQIFIDPGIGFGKTTEHNLQILRNIQEFKS
ncbi:MAG: dihydropteroate synthase, partial [Elusimicrobiota bacterium]|nr:dihydropteroate synthase [Elusimicrobiota bacterium]